MVGTRLQTGVRQPVDQVAQRVLDSIEEEADFGGLWDTLNGKLASNPPESWRELAESEVKQVASRVVEEVNWEDFVPS